MVAIVAAPRRLAPVLCSAMSEVLHSCADGGTVNVLNKRVQFRAIGTKKAQVFSGVSHTAMRLAMSNERRFWKASHPNLLSVRALSGSFLIQGSPRKLG